MEVSREIILIGLQLLIFGVKYGTLRDGLFFCLFIPIWGVGKQQVLGKKY